jgi:cell volume regulation protein A
LSTEHGGLLSLLIVSGGMVLYSACNFVEGSGFLAVYLYGLRVACARRDGSACWPRRRWTASRGPAQATMFLLLGLFVSPHEMLNGAWHTVAVAATLMFVARPLACCCASRRSACRCDEMLFIGWVGLRGAVPIVLALIPVLAHVPGSGGWFNVAFAVVLASLLLQGTTLGVAARRLRMVEPPGQPPPGEGQVQGRLLLDATCRWPRCSTSSSSRCPPAAGATLGEWMTQTMARDRTEGDGLAWHGAHFPHRGLQDGRIARVGVTLAPRRRDATTSVRGAGRARSARDHGRRSAAR